MKNIYTYKIHETTQPDKNMNNKNNCHFCGHWVKTASWFVRVHDPPEFDQALGGVGWEKPVTQWKDGKKRWIFSILSKLKPSQKTGATTKTFPKTTWISQTFKTSRCFFHHKRIDEATFLTTGDYTQIPLASKTRPGEATIHWDLMVGCEWRIHNIPKSMYIHGLFPSQNLWDLLFNHIISYHIISYHITSHHITSYHIMSWWCLLVPSPLHATLRPPNSNRHRQGSTLLHQRTQRTRWSIRRCKFHHILAMSSQSWHASSFDKQKMTKTLATTIRDSAKGYSLSTIMALLICIYIYSIYTQYTFVISYFRLPLPSANERPSVRRASGGFQVARNSMSMIVTRLATKRGKKKVFPFSFSTICPFTIRSQLGASDLSRTWNPELQIIRHKQPNSLNRFDWIWSATMLPGAPAQSCKHL